MNGSNGDSESGGRPLALCPTDLAKLHESLGFDLQEREAALAAVLTEVGIPELAAFHEKQSSLLASDPNANIGVRHSRRERASVTRQATSTKLEEALAGQRTQPRPKVRPGPKARPADPGAAPRQSGLRGAAAATVRPNILGAMATARAQTSRVS